MAGRNKIAKRKGAAKISPLVLFLIWGGLLIGLVAVLILLQNGGLTRQLTAGLPGGSPSGSPTATDRPHACYYKKADGKGGCAPALATNTAKDCDEQRDPSSHAYYFMTNHQCLKEGTYQLTSESAGKYCWGGSSKSVIDEMAAKCVVDVKAAIEKQSCPAGEEKVFLGVPSGAGKVCKSISQWWGPLPLPDGEVCWSDGIYSKRVFVDPSLTQGNWWCNVTCSVLWQCAPVESSAPSPNNIYVSIYDDLDISEGGGLGKAFFPLRVHDIDRNPVSFHGGLTVKYHTEEISADDFQLLNPYPAQEGVDYEGVNSSVTIPDGSSREAIEVTIFEDNEPENDESFRVILDSFTGAPGQFDRWYAIGTIIDNDSN